MSPPWTWACLRCNATGRGDSSTHRCPATVMHSGTREYWTNRLQQPLPDSSPEQIAAVVDKPISRATLVRLFGAVWLGPVWSARDAVQP